MLGDLTKIENKNKARSFYIIPKPLKLPLSSILHAVYNRLSTVSREMKRTLFDITVFAIALQKNRGRVDNFPAQHSFVYTW